MKYLRNVINNKIMKRTMTMLMRMRPITILVMECKPKVGLTCTRERVGWMDVNLSFAKQYFNDRLILVMHNSTLISMNTIFAKRLSNI